MTGNDRQDAGRNECAMDSLLDRRLDDALATAPETYLPPDFAAGVAARMLQEPEPRRMAESRFGFWATTICGVILFLALLVLVPWATDGSPRGILIESALAVQLAILIVGAGPWRSVLRLSF